MSLEKSDRSLQKALAWAMERMDLAGFHIRSKVRLLVDPKLDLMGYAREKDGVQHVVISNWALDSEMLGGLLFHELAHIYHTERRSPSHMSKTINAMVTELSQKEGLNEKEAAYLGEGFNHLQNIMVDDIVFAVMNEQERKMAHGFFSGWVTEQPSGYVVRDSAALVRNAFAIASLKRRNLFEEESPMASKNQRFLEILGTRAFKQFGLVEDFLVHSNPDWNEDEFRTKLMEYLDLLVGILREKEQLEDLR